MDNGQALLLMLGMTAVTYIPRALPAVLVDKVRFGPRTEKFLKLIPYTAMASLIFPGLFSVGDSGLLPGLLGGAAAGLLAWKKCPVMVCVLGAIAVDFLLYLIL